MITVKLTADQIQFITDAMEALREKGDRDAAALLNARPDWREMIERDNAQFEKAYSDLDYALSIAMADAYTDAKSRNEEWTRDDTWTQVERPSDTELYNLD